ncbi:DUF1800 domain-containing protein [Veronia nyctiphanis]|uniref:DUF1800 domain-containing protein n=1 Tax=Veronia nyctiphanis TaxID=1278244 RepID=UPI00191C6461|nr:DUF1800 family protein [Veronia nyctiphanis]
MAVMSDIDNSPKRIHRLLCQATFGANKKDLEAVKVIGFRQWYENQSKVKPSLHLPLSIEFTPDFEKKNRVRGTARLGAWWRNSLEGEDQVRQRMAFALSQIFVVSENGASNHQLLASYYDLLVKHALENFRDLFYDVTLHIAMGRFLTLRGSRKANIKKNTFPDENYARECMQLFTLGLWLLNDDGTPKLDQSGRKIPAYTQEDVEELSRVLTGWSGGSSTSPMVSKSRHHDKGEKTVLGAIFKPKQSAEQDLSQAVDLLFNHPNTPPFIANLLIKRFVASNPRPEFIQRVATVFKNNGKGVRGDLKATLFAILTDPDAVNGVAPATTKQQGIATLVS